MGHIFISSTEAHSGKSAICLGIALNIMEEGDRVGYMKPLGNRVRETPQGVTDEDSIKAREILHLSDKLTDMTPIPLTEDLINKTLEGGKIDAKKRILEAAARINANKDTIIYEGAGDVWGGIMYGLSDPELATMLDSRILMVARYDSDYTIDRILVDYRMLKTQWNNICTGVILNDVSPGEMSHVKKKVVPFLEKKGLKVYGILPQDRILKSFTVAEISKKLRAKVLAGEQNTGNLISRFIVGAMEPGNALKHFRRVSDKAVITGGDRSDIILAALETPTKCIILTGDMMPSHHVILKAEELGVPVLYTKQDTITTVYMTDSFIKRIRVEEGIKLERLRKLIRENVDFKSIRKDYRI